MKQKTFNFALKLWGVPKIGFKDVTPSQYRAVKALCQSLRHKKLFESDAGYLDRSGSASFRDPSHNEEINRYMEL